MNSPWENLEGHPRLTRADVHVWRVFADAADSVAQRLESLLSPDELQRARGFATTLLRRRFTIFRGSLRVVLGLYHDQQPECLEFRYGEFGKPELAEVSGALEFSLTHSDDVALIAVANNRRVGVDIERVRAVEDAARIVERFFAPSEREAFLRELDYCREEAFLRAWTRKEAYLKGIGEGLAFALDRVEVSLASGEPPRLIRVEGRPDEPANWSLIDLEPRVGYLGTLAVEGSCWGLKTYRIDLT